jgi:hypothetical protein
MMLGYIRSLQRLVLADQQARAEQTIAATPTTRKPVKPIDQQITELMRSLPPTVRDRPWQLQDIVNRLEGRYRQRPHAQGVGQALRRLGWSRIRPEDAAGEGRRLWLSPKVN